MKAILRSNINRLFDKGLNYPLVVVTAAAGSGKSTAIDQWIMCNKDRSLKDVKIIRFDAAEKYNEGDTLFLQIFKRLSSITPLWEASFFKLFKDDQEANRDTLIDIFIQGFKQIPVNITIIIDDFHLISSQRVISIINDIVKRLPSNITLILSSRVYPNLSISKFKLEETILIIDGNDLKITPEELTELNALLCHSRVTDSQLAILLQQTEGWFVGIKLALLAYTKDGDKALEEFSGTQPELLNYFAHEVIHKLPTEIRTSLLSISICASFNASLFAAISGDLPNAIHLDQLTQHELLMTPDLEEANWYHFHPLLQSFLLQHLEKEQGKSYVCTLHLKAAENLLFQNKISLAIEHAKHSLNSEFYLHVLLTATESWLKQGEFEPIIDALNELNDQELDTYPTLHIYLIYALTFSRRFNQASFHLTQLKQPNRTQSETDTMRFLTFLINLFQSDAEIQNLNLPKQRTSSETPTDVAGFYLIIEAYNNLYQGELEKAFRLATKAKHLLESIEHAFFSSYAHLIITLCDRYLGRGIQAIEQILGVYKPLKHGPKTPVWVNIASGMIVVEYEQNRLNEALELGEQLIPLVSHSSVTEVILNAYFYSARISHILGDKNKANRLLNQLERILSLGHYERFNSQIIHEKMRQALLQNTRQDIDYLFERYQLAIIIDQGVWSKNETYEEHRERLALACVYALISKQQFVQANEILKNIITVLDRQNLPSRALIARSNIAVIEYKKGNKNEALRQLKRQVSRYGLVCFSRTIFDETPGLDSLFQYAIEHKAFAIPSLFFEIFSTLFKQSSPPAALAQATQGLTEKELAIFELLAEGLSNADISKQSGIALSTTKWHLKNIYQKLDVENRSAALMLAHKASTFST